MLDKNRVYALNYKKCMNIIKNKDSFPRNIQIQTVDSCNGRCIMCPNSYKKKDNIQYIDNNFFKKIVNEIACESKWSNVILMLQNEPFLDPEIINRVRFVKKFGNLHSSIVTNGSLLSKDIISRLEKSGIDSLVVSVDSFNKEIFEKIRLGLDFEKIMQNIELLQNSSLKSKVRIRMILQEKNYLEAKEFVKFWLRKGLMPEVYNLTNRGGVLKNFDEIKVKEKLKFNLKMRRFYKRYKTSLLGFCTYPFFKFDMLLNGDVLPCCHDWKHGLIMGNAKENTIREIWNSEKFNQFRMLQLTEHRDRIGYCKDCSLVQEVDLSGEFSEI